jgi:hypothetical protein
MSTLYELTGAYLQVQNVLADGDEEYPYEMLTVCEQLDQKLENYGRIIRNFEAENDALKAEEERLAERRKNNEKAITRLKESIMNSMMATGRDKVQTNLFSFSVGPAGGKAPLVIEGDVPKSFCKVSYEPDKAKIREAIEKDGEVLNFAYIGDKKTVLKIK